MACGRPPWPLGLLCARVQAGDVSRESLTNRPELLPAAFLRFGPLGAGAQHDQHKGSTPRGHPLYTSDHSDGASFYAGRNRDACPIWGSSPAPAHAAALFQ